MDQPDLEFLTSTPLFQGTSPHEVEAILGCLNARCAHYDKGECVYTAGQRVTSLGLVMEGSVCIEGSDVWGNLSVMGRVGPGETFADAYAALQSEPLLVSVIAQGPTRVLFVQVSQICARCPRACSFHATVNANLMRIMARRNLQLSRRIRDAAPKSIRGKLLAYLSTQAQLAGSRSFDIPYNRQQLADYLGVDRSALSSVIGSLVRAGTIASRRSHFELLS